MNAAARVLAGLFGAVALLAGAPAARAGGGFLPPGALAYDEEQLANGLRLVTQRVQGAPYVSMRLVVKTGTDHYPCRDRELPHLVEHLLFSANADADETSIDQHVSDWGGMINAYTYATETELVLDLHSSFQAEGARLLASLVGRFAPEDADVAREIRVVEQESGVEHTPLRLWWSRLPATWSASARFFRDAGLWCNPGIDPVRHLDAARVRASFDTQYVASNMMLVLVGDLDDEGLAVAREAFGALPAVPPPANTPVPVQMPATGDYASGWLSGTAELDRPTAIGITPFRDWQGYYALQLVTDWLDDRLYRDLRTDAGVAYTPWADIGYLGDAIEVTLSAETRGADTDETLAYLQALVDEVRTQGIPEADFGRLVRSRLLGMAGSFERISDRADYLAASVREIESGGLFDVETFYLQLDHATFSALLARDWPPRFAVFDDAPPVSWSAHLWLLLGSVGLLLAALGLRAWRRLRAATPG